MAGNLKLNLECECCGGTLLKINEGQFKCDHCGYVKYIETATSSEIIAMLNQANNFRNKGEFDDAGDIFKDIVRKDHNNPEGYWGVFLSEYGIMHVEDPATKKFVPTCNRASGVPVTDDENFKKAIELSNELQKKDYSDKAEVIEKIRRKIVELSKNEAPYDVFICYKRTQSIVNGKETYTEDAINARDIYDILTTKGYKVFFAEKTLQNLAGTEYEPLIYNALNTSKVMLVVCSDPELINAPWVKNEWRRFIKQMSFDDSKKLLPIMCGGMKAGRLPDTLKKYQGLEMNVNFRDNLLASISKIIDLNKRTAISRVNIDDKRNVKKSNVIKSNIQTRKIGDKCGTNLVVSDEKLVKVAFSYVERRMFKDATREFNQLQEKEELKNICDFALAYIHFKDKKDVSGILDKFNECIASANESIAKIIFACIEHDLKEALNDENDLIASVLYIAMLSWENDTNESIFKLADKYINTHPNHKSINMLKAVAKCYNNEDVDGYISLLNSYANLYLDNYSIYEAGIVLDKILEVDEGNKDARWKKFLVSFGAKDVKSVDFTAQYITKEHIEIFKDFLGYIDEKKRTDYINKICKGIVNAIEFATSINKLKQVNFLDYYINLFDTESKHEPIAKIENASKEVLKVRKLKVLDAQHNSNNIYLTAKKDSKLLDDTKITVYTNIFDEIIKFYGADNQVELINSLYLMANECKELRQFDLATKYYNLIVNERNTEHRAIWGLLQCKLKCVSNTELINVAQSLSDFNEYNNAIQAAGMVNENAIDEYLNIKQQQDAQRTKTKKKIFLKKIKIAIACVVITVLVAGGLFGLVWYMTPEVTFKNWDGTIICVVTGEERGGKVAPTEEDMAKFTKPDDYYATDYKFIGWSKSVDCVNNRMTVTALYEGTPIYYTMNLSCGNDGKIAYKIGGEEEVIINAGETKTIQLTYKQKITIKQIPDEEFELNAWSMNSSTSEYTGNFEYEMGHETVSFYATFKLSGFTPISNATDLANIKDNLAAKYYLTQDIDLAGIEWTPINGFKGTLDGRGYKISNLTITQLSPTIENNIGLFGKAENARFRYIELENINIQSAYSLECVGSLVGYLKGKNASIDNVKVSGTINVSSGYRVGGLIGYFERNNNLTAIAELESRTTVSANNCVGGIIGELKETSNGEFDFYNCKNYNAVTGNAKNIGGLVGWFEMKNYLTCDVTNCYNEGNIIGEGQVGGLFGSSYGINVSLCSNKSEIKANFRLGSISGHSNNSEYTQLTNTGSKIICDYYNDGYADCGGFIGWLEYGLINNSTNDATFDLTATVSGRIGGLVGSYYRGSSTTLSNLYNNSEISTTAALSEIGGLFGYMQLKQYVTITLKDVANNADVSSTGSSIGGLIGYAYTPMEYSWNSPRTSSVVIDTASVKNVTGNTYVAGLIGKTTLKSCSVNNIVLNGVVTANSNFNEYYN